MNPALSGMPSGFGSASISEVVQVPDELFDWASSSQIQAVLFDVKRSCAVNSLQMAKDGSSKVSVLIDAPSEHAANLARKLLEYSLILIPIKSTIIFAF